MESGFVTSDPKEMVEMLLGIPDVRVLALVEDNTGLWVEIETTPEDANCASCGQPAVPDGRRVVDMKSCQPMFGRPLALSWQARGWRCENTACPVGLFFEETDWRFSAE
jgi:transposase